ncbi:unnamed protein product [Nyctereutes procyonoides]|uniref:(raccoon dog) hypothetical protein n=1 Tax=Nyctereutes procyonoides TaxID=34880 RepID=A0A811YTQ8_NYCPR|nr:unnamed protein product [Nyctereutes procyonoides]
MKGNAINNCPGSTGVSWSVPGKVGGHDHLPTHNICHAWHRACLLGWLRVCAIRALVQQMYQPFQDCCTYWAIYRTAYCPGPASTRLRSTCCPVWKRTSRLPRAHGAAICQPPCQNGGSYTDVDECGAGGGTCPPYCVNTSNSYWCQCQEGYSPSADAMLCLPNTVEEEVQRLWPRVDVLDTGCLTPAASWLTPSGSWTALTL